MTVSTLKGFFFPVNKQKYKTNFSFCDELQGLNLKIAFVYVWSIINVLKSNNKKINKQANRTKTVLFCFKDKKDSFFVFCQP